MSIESLDMWIGATVADRKSGYRNSTPASSQETFADILSELSGKPDLPGGKSQNMVEVARLSQLRMMQGLFVENDDGEDGFLDEANDLTRFSLVQACRSQFVDRYCALQQPSLQTPEPCGRQEIDKLIDRVAEKVNLEPALIHSVVATESDYRADAVSPVGARGLMQLMPETAKELGVTDSFDAHENLLGGSRYLKRLLDKYSGDLDHALAAYNWGPGNVDRHGLARMPEETRNYLTRIKTLLGKLPV